MACYSDTEAPLNWSISNDAVSTKHYDKLDDFDFDIDNFPFLDGNVPRRTSYGVYISELIRSLEHLLTYIVSDLNCRNKALTAKRLRQGYCYHKRREEPDFYNELIYKIGKIVEKSIFFRNNSESL